MDNNLSVERRNLMIMNILMYLLSITNTNITKFEFLKINFELTTDIPYITNFNSLFLLVWIYTYFMFSTSYLYKIKYSEKKESFSEIEVELSDLYFRGKNKIFNVFYRVSKIIFQIVYANISREFLIPIVIFYIVIIMEYNAISFLLVHYYILLFFILFTIMLIFPSIIYIISIISINRKIQTLDVQDLINETLFESNERSEEEYTTRKEKNFKIRNKYFDLLEKGKR